MRKRVLIFVWLFVFPLLGGVGVGYAQIITTVAGGGNCGSNYCGDGGQATAAELNIPSRIIFSPGGNLYFSDQANHRVRKVNAPGIVTTVAGYTNVPGFNGDGGQATSAQLHNPCGVAFDATGNLYIADAYNHRIRMVNASGIISTIAGSGTQGYSGDGGLATVAELDDPNAIAFDTTGNLYISDFGNYRIRKVNTSGVISTIVGIGTAGFSGDGGQASNAELNVTTDVALDTAGNLYIADAGNNRVRIVNATGVISTIAGNGTAGYNGDGGQASAAELWNPNGLTLDAAGNLYIAEADNHRIRMVNTSGVISTIAGNGTRGFSGDGGMATIAQLNTPSGISFDVSGNLFITDDFNNRIRKVSVSIGIETENGVDNQVSVFPNPFRDLLFIQTGQLTNNSVSHTTSFTKHTIEIYNSFSEIVYSAKNSNGHIEIDTKKITEGIYFYKITNSETFQSVEGKIIKIK